MVGRVRALILDLDGVVYWNRRPIPEAPEAVRRLAGAVSIYFLTNDATSHREDYQTVLRGMGIDANQEQIVTSGWGTAHYMAQEAPGARVFLVGEAGFERELREAGLVAVSPDDPERCRFVAVGRDRGFTYAKLERAQREIRENGAFFVAANRDDVYPVGPERVEPGGGAMVAAIETCARVSPKLIGKPSPYLYEVILERSGWPPQEVLMVGDRWDIDVAGARAVGIRTALTLTGITRSDDLARIPEDARPNLTIHHLKEVEAFL
jgi:phosphoglycolate/pyridoxal phosphate phosphatase family enzyme